MNQEERENNVSKMERFVIELIEQMILKRVPTIELVNRWIEYNERKKVTFTNLNHSQRFAAIVKVVRMSYELIKLDKYATKRDIYYTSTKLFNNSQGMVDEIVDDLAASMGTSQRKIHVVAAAKGLVYGNLTFDEKVGSVSSQINCKNFRSSNGRCIPPIIETLSNFKIHQGRNPCFILIVEKDAVYTRLIQDDFCKKNNCILITGKGYPDVATRLFWISIMRKRLYPLHCFILVDADPHGIEIAKVYKYGSQGLNFMKDELCLNEESESDLLERVHWIGLDIVSDFDNFQISDQCKISTSSTDDQKIAQMLADLDQNQAQSSIKSNDYQQWTKQLKYMQRYKTKAEIQALCSKGLSFLSEVFLPQKIKQIVNC